MNEAIEVRWDTAGKMGWDVMVHVNDGGPLLVASIHRTLIEEATPGLAGDVLHRAAAIRDRVEAAIASAYANERFSNVYEAGSAFVMHRGLQVTAADF
jgi:hypothetical protein